MSDTAKAIEFIEKADALDFDYFVNSCGQVAFKECSNSSLVSNWTKRFNWPELDKLREDFQVKNLPLKQALTGLSRVDEISKEELELLERCRDPSFFLAHYCELSLRPDLKTLT